VHKRINFTQKMQIPDDEIPSDLPAPVPIMLQERMNMRDNYCLNERKGSIGLFCRFNARETAKVSEFYFDVHL